MTKERTNGIEAAGEQYSSEMLWQTAENAWSGVTVWNKKDIGPNVNLTVVLCPLYAKSSLESSTLIDETCGIQDSRVANKLKAYTSVVSEMSGYLKEVGGEPKLTVIFANKGILLSGKSSEKDAGVLNHHAELYQEAVGELSSFLGIPYEFFDYDDLGVEFPRFVDPQKQAPFEQKKFEREEKTLIRSFNETMDLPHSIKNNKKSRHVAKGILRMKELGMNGAYWLMAGYLAADHIISEKVGEDGAYLVAERYGPLFRLSKLTPKLHNKVRIQIKA